MKYQKILIGAAVGSALAGVGFLLFHPGGKKFRRKAADLGLEAADKLIEYMRVTKQEHQAATERQTQSRTETVAGTM